MIEDKENGIKIAENPREALVQRAYEASKQRIEQEEFTLELDKVVLKYLESQLKPN